MSGQEDFNDRALSLCLARVCEAAAIATSRYIGLGDEDAAIDAAVAGMETALGRMDIAGRIVVGEGLDGDVETLFIGQNVGNGNGPEVDIALESLEGTTLAAKAMPDALSVIAMGMRGSMLQVPGIYMDKVAIGPGYPDGLVTLDMSPSTRISKLAEAKGCPAEALTVCVLDRPRHAELIAEIRATGARIRLIGDGDVAGVIHAAETGQTGIDIYMGIGGAPEGILAAAALRCLGGQMQGRLIARNADEAALAKDMGITDLERVYSLTDMVSGPVVFAATGVTNGALLKGIRRQRDMLETDTLLMRSRTGSVRHMLYRKKLSGTRP